MMFFQSSFWRITIKLIIFIIKIIFVLFLIIVNNVDDEWNENFEKKMKFYKNEFENKYWLNEATGSNIEKTKLMKLNFVSALCYNFNAFCSITLFIKRLKIKFVSFICFFLIDLFLLCLSLNIIFLNMFLIMHFCYFWE